MENQEGNISGSGSGHSRKHSSGRSTGHTHRRHHRHSSGQHRSSSKPYLYPKRPRIEDRPRREKEKKIESLLTKNILTIFGIIFIAGAVWFGTENWRSFESYIGTVLTKSSGIDISKAKEPGAVSFLTPASLRPNPKVAMTSYIPFLIFSLTFILTSLAISLRRKNLSLRLFSFAGFILLMAWLLFKLFITADLYIFFAILSVSTVFFILFFTAGIVDPYPGKRKWKLRTEYSIILLNSLLFYLVIKAALFKSHYRNFEPAFIFLLSSFHLIALYFADKKERSFRKVPYLLATLLITCLFLPVIFGHNQLILFLAPLSVFLVIFSRFSHSHRPVNYSLLAMFIMVMFYFYQWAHRYLPSIVSIDDIQNNSPFYKGLISSVFTLSSLAINIRYLRRLSYSLSIKWLKKFQYFKYLRAFYFIVAYLSGYWVFNFLIQLFMKDDRANLIIWFAYNCFYFIIFVHRLGRQHSSFFRLIVITAIISTFTYFTFYYLNLVSLRKMYLEMNILPAIVFFSHYVATGLLIWLLFTLLHNFKRAFPGKKNFIKSFWVYIYLISTFILLTEFDHLSVLLADFSNKSYDAVLAYNKKLPYSILLILSSSVVILTGFLIQSRFLRIFSLFILGAVLVKILIYDRNYLSPQANFILFLVIGILLLMMLFLYPMIRRTFFQKDSTQSQKFYSGGKTL